MRDKLRYIRTRNIKKKPRKIDMTYVKKKYLLAP